MRVGGCGYGRGHPGPTWGRRATLMSSAGDGASRSGAAAESDASRSGAEAESDDASELVARHATDETPGEAPKAPAAAASARSAMLVTAGILLSKVFGL